VPRSKWRQDGEGLHLEITMAQRLYTDRKWPDPIAIRITHAEPGLTPPEVGEQQAEWDASARTATLRAVVTSLGKAPSVEAGFQYRRKVALYEEPEPWSATALMRLERTGPYAIRVAGLEPGRAYEFRAIVRHPLLEMYGRETPFTPR
jgi:alpha-L-fucosidase